MASPDVVFNQTIDAALTRNNPRRQPETPATVDQWNLEKSLAFYKARFADASNFTFVFVGSFTPEAIKPLVETYIASLPATHANETWRDLGITPPAGIVERRSRRASRRRARSRSSSPARSCTTTPHRLALRTMTLVLQSRLLDTIRQELGGTYSITATPRRREVSAAGVPRPDRLDVRSGADGDAGAARVRGDRIRARHAAHAGPGGLIRDVAAAGVREEQPGQRISAEPDRAPLRGRRRGERRGASTSAGAIAALTGDAIQQAAQTYLDTGTT